ncbi:MAG: DUF2975 domain-containing protein [Pseudomonadota bacterium]
MQRIKTISTYMCTFLTVLLIVYPVLMILQWLLIDWTPFKKLVIEGVFFTPIETPEGIVNIGNIALSSLAKCIGILTSLICYMPIGLGLFLLRKVFTNYQRGQIFVFDNAKVYQKMGWLFFLNALVFKPLSGLGMIFAVTLSNPPGHRYITLSFGTPNLESIFCGIILIIISWVMMEGHRLQSEQELTI